MSRIRPECFDSDPSNRLPADVLLREYPDEEEEEDEDDGKKHDDDDNDDNGDGYSE